MSSSPDSMPPPQPVPDARTLPYWEHAGRGELAISRCSSCAEWHFPPPEFCRECGSADFEYVTLSGRGSVYTFIIQHHRVAPGFAAALPYAIALVTPDEAPEVRLLGRVVDTPIGAVKIGKPAQVVFVDHKGGDFTIPCWRIVG